MLERCPVCEGRGTVPYNYYTSNDSTSINVGVATCNSCQGNGYISIDNDVEVKKEAIQAISKLAQRLCDLLEKRV